MSCCIGEVDGNAEPRLPVALWSGPEGGKDGGIFVDGEETSSPQSSSSLVIFEVLRDGGTEMLVWAMECGRGGIPLVGIILLVGSASGEEVRLAVGGAAGGISAIGGGVLEFGWESFFL